MFLECSNCDFKYLVNSADLKPNGRMVECANCGHQWYQDINEKDDLPINPTSNENNINKNENLDNIVKNLPSTVVRDEKPSIINSIILLIIITLIFIGIWISRSFEINTLVLIDFYIKEFIFNLNLIVSDLGKIIYNILN